MKKIRLTTEVPRERILAIIYASYFLGYEHHAKQLLLTHPESVKTRKFLNSLVDKVYEKKTNN